MHTRDGSGNARHARSPDGRRGTDLQKLAALGAGAWLALVCSPAAADGFSRTVDVFPSPIELRLTYAPPAALGTSAMAGEGSLGTRLPYEGRLTLRLPHVVGESPALGNAQVGVSYDIAREGRLLPNLAIAARVDLPTAHGARNALPGVRATVGKRLAAGPLESLRLETEMWTNGPQLTPSYRTLVGATFRLRAATSGSLDFIAIRPAAGFGPEERMAQLGLSQRFGGASTVRLGLATGLVDGANSLRATIGLDTHF